MTNAYAAAGVDIAAATRAKELMAAAVRATHGPAVLAGMGAFGGCFDLGAAGVAGSGILVASTDGVGTKTLVATALGRYASVGQDLVNHCVNDILVQGATPLFFLDYVAAARLAPEQVAAIVGGVAAACQAVGCALLGGETAEMPDVYAPDGFDLAGTIVGIVSREAMLPRPNIAPGDLVLALPSSGLHTNGYSLARKIVAQSGMSYHDRPASLEGLSIGEALLAIHRCYLPEVQALRAAVTLKGLAHITGGGVYDNLPRALPAHLGATLTHGSWAIPPICTYLVEQGDLKEQEAYHALNMGLGMLAIIAPDEAPAALAACPEARVVGAIREGAGVALV
ncbi:phosphoribosylformylglycinamidine cyclo-ligase [Candidatus Viridilinea mediisalina]|uniref:Phosphoribosylformylglycinamidine cyclo-ligase n=1 Tax=Candidatus Viridilinea mediisalina TaxID=2024553 RepID=A0A2A6RDW9_9CHLR|nr:phosphoribosylformylglycinamidine cyclo-ligase [Candidatus Viridilinea mediisalina]PDW00155.1 phosphoribosylformylglycinamidine cyclo-ligase [Candidatus Viridilinea mediisalina]